jgi:hypothetical protein
VNGNGNCGLAWLIAALGWATVVALLLVWLLTDTPG